MDAPLVIAILVFIVILLFCLGISSYLKSRQQTAEWRQRVKGREDEAEAEEIPQRASARPKPFLNALGALGGAIEPEDEKERSHIRRTLITAGYRRPTAPLIFFGAKLCLAILLPILFVPARTFAMPMMTSSSTMFLLVVLAVGGFYLPSLWVRMRAQHRKRKIFEGFPDALDLMVVCVEAGLGLDAAINRVAEEMKLTHPILSEEFRLVNLELRAGQARETALRNLSLRIDLEDVSSLVTLLIQTEKFGTSVAQALRVQSDAMRVKRHQRAEELAAKLPVKLLFPLIFFIFPSLFVVIIGPGVIQIMRILLPTLAGE